MSENSPCSALAPVHAPARIRRAQWTPRGCWVGRILIKGRGWMHRWGHFIPIFFHPSLSGLAGDMAFSLQSASRLPFSALFLFVCIAGSYLNAAPPLCVVGRPVLSWPQVHALAFSRSQERRAASRAGCPHQVHMTRNGFDLLSAVSSLRLAGNGF